MDEATLMTDLTDYLWKEKGTEAAQVTRESRLTEDLDLDSIDLIELVMVVEQKYGLTLSDEAAGAMQTVGDVLDLLLRETKVA